MIAKPESTSSSWLCTLLPNVTRVLWLTPIFWCGCTRTTDDVGVSRRSLESVPSVADTTAAPAIQDPITTRFCAKGESAEVNRCFDRARLVQAADGLAQRIEACYRVGEPTGDGSVRLTFESTTGSQTALAVEAPFAGTIEGACIGALFGSIRVPPFQGAPYSIGLHFRILGLDGGAPSPPTGLGSDGGGAIFGGSMGDGG